MRRRGGGHHPGAECWCGAPGLIPDTSPAFMRVSFSGAATRQIWANPFGCDPDAPARTQLHRARPLLLLTAWVEQETQLGTQGTHLTLHAAEWTCIMDEAAAVDTRMQSSPMCIGMRRIWTPPPAHNPIIWQWDAMETQQRHFKN